MRRRNKLSNKIFIFFSLFFLIALVIILANFTPGLKGSIDQELRIIFNQSERIISYSPKNTFLNIINSIKYINANRNKYEKLKLDISFKNLKILKDERKKALSLGKNISRKKVPIKITHEGKTFNASARLKGGLADHYGNNKQFSLMIKIKKNQSINGMKEFSITQHVSRQFPQNVVYSEMLSSIGIASPKFITYRINLNGDDWGIMLAEEQYSDAYFELRKKKYSPIFKLTNEDNSDILRTLFKELKSDEEKKLINFINYKHGKIENSIYNRNDFKHFYYSYVLSHLKDFKYDLLNDRIGAKELGDYIDMDKFSKIFILSIIAGEYHALAYRNIRFYANPFTKKFEPIPTDWGSFKVRKILNENQLKEEFNLLINCNREVCNRHDHILYEKILNNKKFQDYFKINLQDFNKVIDYGQMKLKYLCEFQNDCREKFDSKLIRENLNFLKKNINYYQFFSYRD